MTNEEKLLEQMKAIMAENEALKARNAELIKAVEENKDWKTIRESFIYAKLEARYGHGGPVYYDMAKAIGEVVKQLLGIARLTDVNFSNYDQAKAISLAVLESIEKFEWPRLKKLQEHWSKNHIFLKKNILPNEMAIKGLHRTKSNKNIHIQRGDCMEWKVESFIKEKPIEEYSEKEVNDFFKKAWDKAFRALGYEPFIDEEELEKCPKTTC